MKAVGTRPTYQIFAAVTFMMGIVYFFFNHLYLRKHQVEGNDIVKKKPKNKPALNGIDNIALDLGEKIEKKKLEADELTSQSKIYTIDAEKNNEQVVNNISKDSKSVEAINNEKNHDIIEKYPDDDRKFKEKNDDNESEKKENNSIKNSNEQRR